MLCYVTNHVTIAIYTIHTHYAKQYVNAPVHVSSALKHLNLLDCFILNNKVFKMQMVKTI